MMEVNGKPVFTFGDLSTNITSDEQERQWVYLKYTNSVELIFCGLSFVIFLDTDLLQVKICVDANLIRVGKAVLYAVINGFVQKVLNSICRFVITHLFLPLMPLKCAENFVLCAIVCNMGSFMKIKDLVWVVIWSQLMICDFSHAKY